MSGKSLRVNLIANTSQFKSAMAESSNQIKLLNSEFKNAAAETDKYGNKLDATGAKKKQLNGIIEQYKNRIKAIKEEQRHWTRELEKGNITEEQHAQKQQELARRLNNTEAEMKRYEGQLKRINAEGKATTRTYADFDRQFRNVGRTMRNVGAQVGITSGVGFMGMKRVLSDVVGEAKSFYYQMSEVQAISGATADEMKVLTNQSKDLGKATMFTSQQASEAQANLARAGFKVNEIYESMPGLLDLAASSKLDLGNAADITSNIIRTFNFEANKAGKVADVLAKGAATANTDVAGLGESMKTAGPVANSLGIQFESVAAATGLMADAGIDGSQAGRMLRQGMLRLSKPTGDAGKLIKKMGVNVFDADGSMKSLDKVVAELQKGLKGYNKQQKAAALATIFGSESTAGWTVLLDKGSDTLKDYTKDLENSEGAAKDMADTMQDNAEGAIIRMQSALSGLKIELGEKLLPILSKAADWIGDLANKFSELDEETVTTIAQAGLLVTAVLGVTTAVAGLVTGIGALMAFAGPIGLAITGGVALLGGLAAAIYSNELKTKKLKEEQEKAKTEAIRYGEGLSEGTLKGVKGYTDLYEGAKIKMIELKTMSGKEAKKTSAEVVKAFSEMADAVIAELETQRDKLSNAINEVYAIAGDAGKEAASKLTNEVLEKFDKDIAEYKKALDTVKEAHEKFGQDTSQMPADFAKAYQEALGILEGGAKEFAKTQDELHAIQKNINEKQGKVLFDEAQGYLNRIDETYRKSLESANKWYVEKSLVFKQALDQGKITQEQYNSLMTGVESRTNEMLALAVQEYDKTNQELAKHLDKRGKLIDIKTGEEFERKKEYIGTVTGYMHEVAESEEDYLKRWKEHTAKVLKNSADFSERTKKAYQKDLQAFLESSGATKDEAAKQAKETVDKVLTELEKDKEKAKKAGKDKGEAHKKGIEETKAGNKKAGKDVKDATNSGLGEGKSDAGKHGKDKGIKHKQGIESTKNVNKAAGKSVAIKGVEGLKSVKTGSAGTDFVAGFRGSIASGSGSIWSAAWNLGKNALNALKKSIDSHSPSKESEKEGINFTDGFTLAIEKNKKQAVASSKAMGKESIEALSSELDRYKQTFGAVAFALEKNKQTLKVEHTLDNKFEQFLSMFKIFNDKSNNDQTIKELLNATLQQNQILMQLLQKDFRAEVAFDSVYKPIKKRLNEDQYNQNQFKRRR